jgi:predicted N-acetyltransferase YhbS
MERRSTAAKATTDTDIQFRRAQPSDVEAIVRLINRAFLVERPFIDGDRTSVEQLRELFEKAQFFVAEQGSELIGCVCLEARADRGYLGLLSIDPSRQGLGIGSRLTLWAEEQAGRIPVTAIDLRIVSGRSGLPDFYSRLGYRVTGTEPFPPGVPTKVPCHFIKMSKQLDGSSVPDSHSRVHEK